MPFDEQRNSDERKQNIDARSKLDFWVTSPKMLEMWAAWTQGLWPQGRLQELLIRSSTESNVEVLMLTAQLAKHEDSQNAELNSEGGGFLHFLPTFQTKTELMVNALIGVVPPWQSPTLMGFVGYPLSGTETDDRTWFITYENPDEFHYTLIRDKRDPERLHLERFITDYILQQNEAPYDEINFADDPPDFHCRVGSSTVAVETTQFTSQSRRSVHGAFGYLRKAVMEAVRKDRSAFLHLVGSCIYMRFDLPEGRKGFPPGVNLTDDISEIVQQLKCYRPNYANLWHEGDHFPEQTPDISLSSLPLGCSFHAAPFQNSLPETTFFAATGFEMGLGYLSSHTFDDSWERLASLIQAKDKPGNDHLLVTVGGPNADGLVFISDEIVADVALLANHKMPALSHLKQVWMHFWSSKKIVQLVPERRTLGGWDVLGATKPPHFQIPDYQEETVHPQQSAY